MLDTDRDAVVIVEDCDGQKPNDETLQAFEDIDNRKNLQYANDLDDMCRKLGF